MTSTASNTHETLPEYDESLEIDSPLSTIRPGADGVTIFPNGRGQINFHRNFLSKLESQQLLADVRDARSFARTAIRFEAGRMVQPRDTAFFGTKLYSYGGEKRMPTGWDADAPASTAVRALGNRIERFLGLDDGWFDLVLVNRYNDGRDFMEWHSDNERNLGDEPVIASVSVGAERKFQIRPRRDGQAGLAVDKIEYTLADGSLLVMSGKMQKFYQHAVPKAKNGVHCGIRINFTFRRIIDENDFGIHPTEW